MSGAYATGRRETNASSILTRQVVSVFYELRSLLYLGILLFTTGAGLLIYENIGELGHLLSIIGLFVLTLVCFAYAFKTCRLTATERPLPPRPSSITSYCWPACCSSPAYVPAGAVQRF